MNFLLNLTLALLLTVAVIAGDDFRTFTNSKDADKESPVLIGKDGNSRFATHRHGRMIASDGDKVALAYMSNDTVFGTRVAELGARGRHLDAMHDLGGRLVRGKPDDHNYPSLVRDGKGSLHVFYGCHGTPLLYRQRPPGSAEWSAEREIASDATYPRAFCGTKDEMFVFFRRGNASAEPVSYGYVVSRDRGVTWSEFQPVITSRLEDGVNAWPYVGGVLLRGDTVHLALSWWYYRTDGTGRKEYDDPCYCRVSLSKHTIHEADGIPLSLPVSRSRMTPITQAENLDVNDLCLDHANKPVVLLVDARQERSVLAQADSDGRWNLSSDHPQDEGQSPWHFRFVQDVPPGQGVFLCAAKGGGVELSTETTAGSWETIFTPLVDRGKIQFPQACWNNGQIDLFASDPSGPGLPSHIWWHRIRVPGQR